MAKTGKSSKVKNAGAAVIKRMLKEINKIDTETGGISVGFTLKGASDFTTLKRLKEKFPEAAKSAHNRTLHALAAEIKVALTDAMNSPVYDWDYGDGDIVQTGQLRDSIGMAVTENSITITYSALSSGDGTDYAAIVYFGGYIHPYGNTSVTVYMPARPWVKHVLTGGGPVPKFPLTDRYSYWFGKYLTEKLPDVKP